MSDVVCLLLTIVCQVKGELPYLIKCALKINRDAVSEKTLKYPMEPKHRGRLHNLLPLHVSSCGEIVAVEQIFWVRDLPLLLENADLRLDLRAMGRELIQQEEEDVDEIEFSGDYYSIDDPRYTHDYGDANV